MCILAVVEEPGGSVFTKVVIVAEKAGVVITPKVVSTSHRMPSGGEGSKLINAEFDNRDTEHQLI